MGAAAHNVVEALRRDPARGPCRLLPISLVVAAALLAACSSGSGFDYRAAAARGEFARAAAKLDQRATTNRADRNYMLDRMNLGLLRLAEGRPDTAEPVMNALFETLRTQGINDDKTVAAAIFGEGGVIFWKGEPFEQAMAYAAISTHKAIRGEWDNARAAALSSLFLLKDFGENERGQRKTTVDIAREAAQSEARHERGNATAPTYEEYLDKGYTPAKTDFALGYFLAGAANLALARGAGGGGGGDPAREDEARDNFREAFTLRPAFKPVVDALVESRANTIIIVDYGLGPEKVGYGPDDALARFVPVTRSDERPLRTAVGSRPEELMPLLHDVNRMSADHMWNNLEDVRSAKSTLGTALLAGGAITTAASGDDTGQLIGVILMGAGLLLKATSAADTRHAELLPQRTYAAALSITEPDTTVRLALDGASTLVLPALDPPEDGQALALHYVRLPFAPEARSWAAAGRIVYANNQFAGDVTGDDLPYILGGRCVRSPSLEALQRYQASGYLLDHSVADLANLYQAEGIIFDDRARELAGRDSMHILEGGRTLIEPVAGSTGYVRLFCQQHPPYEPRSREVADLAARLRNAARPVLSLQDR